MGRMTLKRHHVVIGPYTLDGAKLTFRTVAPLLCSNARQAMAARQDFTVNLTASDGLREITGKVIGVVPVKGAKPAQHEITMSVMM